MWRQRFQMGKEHEEKDTDLCLEKKELIHLLVWTFLLGKQKGPGPLLDEVWGAKYQRWAQQWKDS